MSILPVVLLINKEEVKMNELDNLELEEFDSIEEGTDQQESNRFEIQDLDTANWAFRKITAFKKRIQEKEALAKAENERINNWLESATKSDKNSITKFEQMLIAYYQKNREQDGKFKLTTPYGKLTSTSRKPIVTVTDEDKALMFVSKHNPKAVETIYKYNKNELKKLITVVEKENGFLTAVNEDGEILDFIGLENQSDSYKVKTEEDL